MAFVMPPEFWDHILWVWKGIAGWDPLILVREVGPVLLAILCLYHAYKNHGWWKTTLFFTGSFLFTGLEENFWIIIGHASGQDTYYFNPYNYYLWFGTVPLSVCIGWFFIAYGMVFIVSKLLPNRSVLTHATLGGLLAMNLDLMIDPIAVRNVWWLWPQAADTTFWIMGIPFTNFVGWFLLIFLFAILWEKIPPKEELWGRKKTTLAFYGGLAAFLGLTLLILLGSQILASVLHLNGINLFNSLFPIKVY
jgi:uncharacterized membrane protein